MTSTRPAAPPVPRDATPPVLTLTLNPAIDLDLQIPSWRPEKVSRAVRVARQAGGKGVNVARALAALGVPATAAVALGEPDAAVYRALLQDAPFEIATLAAPGPTRTNVTIAAGAGGRRLKVNQPGPRWSRSDGARLLKAIEPLLAGRQWVALAGAPPPGLPEDVYAQVASMARRAGARVAIDAAGASLRHALKARPDLVRINRQELSETLGLPAATLARGRAATLAASARLLAMGCAMVAISNGAREAFLVAAEGAWTGRPPRIEPRGALGAGDAMLAGLIAALLREDAPADVLRLGLACGSAAASEPETRPPRRRAIRALFGQVATRPVACFKGAVSFSDAF